MSLTPPPPHHHRRRCQSAHCCTYSQQAALHRSLRCTARPPLALVIGEACDRRASHQLSVYCLASSPCLRPVRLVQLTKQPVGRTVVGVPCTSTRYAHTKPQGLQLRRRTHRRHARCCNLQELLVAPQPSLLLLLRPASPRRACARIAYTSAYTPQRNA